MGGRDHSLMLSLRSAGKRGEHGGLMRKINEIFYSLRGEGHHEGYPSVFVRFSGCNLNCSFCDTAHTEGIYMDDDAIIRAINLIPLTG